MKIHRNTFENIHNVLLFILFYFMHVLKLFIYLRLYIRTLTKYLKRLRARLKGLNQQLLKGRVERRQ